MRWNFRLVGLGVLLALALGSLPSTAGPRPAVSVVIELHDAIGLPAEVLNGAKEEVARTFVAAGVQIVWSSPGMTTPAADLRSPCVRRLQLRIVSGPPADRHDYDTWAGVLGKAQRGNGRAEVFYRRLATAASLHPIAVSLVLGHVISHELGHLLLPSGNHADVGIMRQAVDFRHVAFRRFTDEQSTRILAGLAGDREVSSCAG